MLHHLGRLESGGCYHLLRNSEAEWGLPYLQESIKKAVRAAGARAAFHSIGLSGEI